LYHLNGKMYGLLAYSIMPNHVHLLIRPFDREAPTDSEREAHELGETADAGSPLSKIMHSLKGFTAHMANKILARSGQFWQHESYDHWVRDEIELERIVAYINANAIKAGLASLAHEYFWCSAHDRYLYDGDKSGWVCGTSEDACAT
jgi:putative transposase